jgi:hypothetical protein
MRCAVVGFNHAVRGADGQAEVSKLIFFFFLNLIFENTKRRQWAGHVEGDGYLIRTHKRDVHDEKTHKIALVTDNMI